MADGLTEMEVCRLLQRECDSAGGLRVWAAAHGVSPQIVCDVLNARRPPGKRLCAALGLRKAVVYAKVSTAA